jgi:hypothetical protein
MRMNADFQDFFADGFVKNHRRRGAATLRFGAPRISIFLRNLGGVDFL